MQSLVWSSERNLNARFLIDSIFLFDAVEQKYHKRGQ